MQYVEIETRENYSLAPHLSVKDREEKGSEKVVFYIRKCGQVWLNPASS